MPVVTPAAPAAPAAAKPATAPGEKKHLDWSRCLKKPAEPAQKAPAQPAPRLVLEVKHVQKEVRGPRVAPAPPDAAPQSALPSGFHLPAEPRPSFEAPLFSPARHAAPAAPAMPAMPATVGLDVLAYPQAMPATVGLSALAHPQAMSAPEQSAAPAEQSSQLAEPAAMQPAEQPSMPTVEPTAAPKYPQKAFTSSLDAFGNPSPSVLFGSSVEEAKASSGSASRASRLGLNRTAPAPAQPMQPAMGYFPDTSFYTFAPFSSMYSDYSALGTAPGMQPAPQAQTEEASSTQAPSEPGYAAETSGNYMSYQVGVEEGREEQLPYGMNSYYPYLYKWESRAGLMRSMPTSEYDYNAYGSFGGYSNFVAYNNYGQAQMPQGQTKENKSMPSQQ